MSDHALRRFREQFGPEAPLPGHFITAQDPTPAEHIRMQAAVQRHVDSAISKTVNLPEDMPFEALEEIASTTCQRGPSAPQLRQPETAIAIPSTGATQCLATS